MIPRARLSTRPILLGTAFFFLFHWVSVVGANQGRIIVANVVKENIVVVPLLDTILMKSGARVKSSKVDRVTGISIDGEQLFAVSRGRHDERFRIISLALSSENNSTLDFIDSGILIDDDDRELEDFRPNGLLWAKGEDAFLVSHDDDTISTYDTNGTKLADVEKIIESPLLFERAGDGLKSLTAEPNAERFWTSSLVGQIKDGTQHVRLMQFDATLKETNSTRAQFIYILESESPTSEDSTQPSTMPTSPSSQNPSSIPSDMPSLAPTSLMALDSSLQTWDQLPVLYSTRVKRPLPSQGRWRSSHVEEEDNGTPPTLPRNGLVALVALDSFGDFLALERVESHNLPDGTTRTFKIQLFYVETAGAFDVTDIEVLDVSNVEDIAARKTLLVDFDDLDLGIESVPNLESMTLIPSDDDNTLTLILASNNEYETNTDTYVMVLPLNYERADVVHAQSGTHEFVKEGTTSMTALHGKAESSMVWIHPQDPSKSLVIGAHGVGVTIFDLKGNEVFDVASSDRSMMVQTAAKVSATYSLQYSWFRDLDIIYAFPIAPDRLVDLIVLADSRKNALTFQIINPFTARQGEFDDGTGRSETRNYSLEAADLVTAYTSPYTGTYYVFVADIRSNNTITQLQLNADQMGRVETTFVRTLSMPPGELAAMTIDKDKGILYVSIMNGSEDSDVAGIYKYDAEPDPQNTNTSFLSRVMSFSDSDGLKPPFTDLTMYYAGDNTQGYLLAAHPKDSSFAIFDREGENDFIGTFQVESSSSNNLDDHPGLITSSRISVLNVNLGEEFPCGVLLVQNSLNTDHESVKVRDNVAYTVQSNFQMVKLDEIATLEGTGAGMTLPVDTHSWHPRRIALVRLVDKIAQEVFVQMTQGLLAAQIAKELLEHLGAASYELYRPGSVMRQIMMNYSYVGNGSSRRLGSSLRSRDGTRRNDEKPQEDESQRRHLRWRKNNMAVSSTTTTTTTASPPVHNIFQNKVSPRCTADPNEDEHGSYARASAQLKEFVWKVGAAGMVGDDLDDIRQNWIERIQSIVWEMPEDIRLLD